MTRRSARNAEKGVKELSYVITHRRKCRPDKCSQSNPSQSHTVPSSLFSAKDLLSLNYITVGDLDFFDLWFHFNLTRTCVLT